MNGVRTFVSLTVDVKELSEESSGQAPALILSVTTSK